MKIKPKDKAKALAALYNASKAQGMGFLHFTPEDMTEGEAAEVLSRGTGIDYLKGRVIKVNFAPDDLDFRLYDRDNGQSAGERAVMEYLTDPSN